MRTLNLAILKFGILFFCLFLPLSEDLFSQYTAKIGSGTATNSALRAAPINCLYPDIYSNFTSPAGFLVPGTAQQNFNEADVNSNHPNYESLMGYRNLDQTDSYLPDQKKSNNGINHEAIYVPSDASIISALYDASITAIISPVSGAYLTNAETVTVEVTNNGLSPISNLVVGFSVNGTGVIQTISNTILPGGSLLFTFTQTANLFQTGYGPMANGYGTYQFCAYTLLSNDELPGNDTLCNSIINYGDGMLCSTALPYQFINNPAVTDSIAAGESEWWKVVALVDFINVTFSLCGSSFDTKIEIYDSCGGSAIAFNDNFCGNQSKVIIPSLVGGNYYVRVYGSSPSSFGTYILTITGTAVNPYYLFLIPSPVLCNGDANGLIDLTVTNIVGLTPFTYAWSNGAVTEDIFGLSGGTYLVTVTDSIGSLVTGEVVVTEPGDLVNNPVIVGVTAIGSNDGSITNVITGGTAPFSFFWSNGATTQNLTNIYAGNYSVIITDANNCQIIQTINVPTPVPIGWQVTPTNISHTIDVSHNSLITLNGINAAPGSLIGVFFNQGTTMVCGGYTVWSGIPASLEAYGATTGQDNGFHTGEQFAWKLYEVGLGVEYSGTACYIPLYPQSNTFLAGGSSAINCLNAISIFTHTINLPAGWSIWSTYISPANPNIVTLFDSITSFVTIIKSGSGLIYWPQYSINSIGNLVIGQGYQIKMTASKILNIQGQLVDPVVSPVNLPNGWSIMGYLRTSPMNAATVISPIVASVIIVKSGSGLICWPQYGLNTIGDMAPGQGYQIKMLQADVLYFQPNTAAPSKKEIIKLQPEKYFDVPNTGHNMSLGILEGAWDVSPQEGDEIGVFNANGDLIGSCVYQNGFNAITVWGDDSFTNENECIAEGQPFVLKLWQFSQNKEQELLIESLVIGSNQYSTDAISVIEKLKMASGEGDAFVLYQNKPNPFHNSTEIEFYIPETSQVNISIFNSLGVKIGDIVSKEYSKGKFSVTFDATELPFGTYFYQFKSDRFTQTKALSLLK